MIIYYQKIKSAVGSLYVYADETALRGIYFDQNHDLKNSSGFLPARLVNKENSIIKDLKKQLSEYFKGQRTNFDLPLVLEGTEFQVGAWKTLMKIPFGKTISYAKQAQQIRKPKAVRAIGSANGKNPFPIIIPCHRVIAADKGLGGYSGGLEVKRKLLAHEQKVQAE